MAARWYYVCVVKILAFIAAGLSSASPSPASPPAPNVLLITSEDNGPELGCYGDPFVSTPHLDRLAAEGLRFERAFVPTASCSESRAALLTGLYPHQNGQIGLATHHYRMFGKVPNLVAGLKAAGYRTGLIGKLHINPERDFPFDYRPNVGTCNTFSHRDVRRVAELASEFFIAGDGPFFLMVNYADAHLPFLRQQHGLPEKPLTGDDVKVLPWVGVDTPRLREAQADYYNCIQRMDTGVGLLLAALSRADLAPQTLVIYLGDHGAQFSRGKLGCYESSLRVPLIVRWPQRLAAGQVREELVSTIDVVPTIYEAVGVDASIELSGRSLLCLAAPADAGAALPWRTYLHCEYHGHYPPLFFPQRTVRDDRYKLIVNLLQDRVNPVAEGSSRMAPPRQPSYVSPAEIADAPQAVIQAYATWHDAPPVELYDLHADPYEWRNRADDPALAGVRARLLAELERWQQETADPLADPDKLAKLTAEHDAVPQPYRKPSESPWKYPNYLAPGNVQHD